VDSLAMLLEYYPDNAKWLAEDYDLQFLQKLMNQTAELRRDPAEREREAADEAIARWERQFAESDQKLQVTDADGNIVFVDVNDF
jgi:hypothetical protein